MRHVSFALLLFLLISAVIIGLALRAGYQEKVLSVVDFTSCAQLNYPVLESYPRQCKGPNGKMFVEKISITPKSSDTTPLSDAQEKNIRIIEPVSGQKIKNPVFLLGEARVFENVLAYRLTDENGVVLKAGNLTTRSRDVGEFGQFDARIRFATSAKKGTLEVFSNSPKDGSEINSVQIPIRF